MENIDFNKPNFDNGISKWYLSPHFTNYIESKQADNLPALENYGCFIVKYNGGIDYTLIDDKQKIWGSYKYNLEGKEQMKAKINILKIVKYYDDVQ